MTRTLLTLADLAAVAELLAETGWTGPTLTHESWTWHGHRAPGEPLRVTIRADGVVAVYGPPTDGGPGLLRWVHCDDDTRQMVDELATAGILSWAYHSAADQAFAMVLDDGDCPEWMLTDEALALLAEGVSSGAGDA